MKKLVSIVQETVRSPLFFAYWGVNLVDKAVSILPAGSAPIVATTILGAAVAVTSAVLFFKLFSQTRARQLRNDRRGAWNLFAAQWGFRLRLILIGVPFAIAMIAAGSDKIIVEKYHAFEAAPVGQNWAQLMELVVASGFWGALFLLFCLIDTSGTGVVAAQGRAEGSLKNAFRLFPKAAIPITSFFVAELLVGTLGYAGGMLLAPVTSTAVAAFVISTITTPLSLLLQLCGMLYVGAIYLDKAADKLKCAFAAQTDPQPHLK